ncbi:MAG: hypothetical protein ABIA93_02790 [Candidatus Woesearchaeota archaeon]
MMFRKGMAVPLLIALLLGVALALVLIWNMIKNPGFVENLLSGLRRLG